MRRGECLNARAHLSGISSVQCRASTEYIIVDFLALGDLGRRLIGHQEP
jgi:hypothetical protein